MKKLCLLTCVLILSAFVFNSCKKKSEDQNLDDYNTVKTAKFTITTTNLLASDNLDIHFVGGDAQGAAQTVFKINGVEQANQRNITLTYAQLKAGVTVESTTPLNTIVAGISGSSGTANHTFSFLFKPVVNGKAETDVSATLTYAGSYSKSLTYK